MAYIDILGHPTWVSDDGSSGSPVLLLHGGLLSSETSWADLPGRLGGRHRVVMFDRRGHGRTADTPAPFHYSAMADETAGVIETLKLAPVDVLATATEPTCSSISRLPDRNCFGRSSLSPEITTTTRCTPK